MSSGDGFGACGELALRQSCNVMGMKSRRLRGMGINNGGFMTEVDGSGWAREGMGNSDGYGKVEYEKERMRYWAGKIPSGFLFCGLTPTLQPAGWDDRHKNTMGYW